MATYTDTHGYDKGSAASSAKGLNLIRVEKVTMNFATITTDRVTAGATALGAGDILQALHVPANTFVISAGINVTTVEGATQTFDLGDGDDPDGYLDGVNGNAVASYSPTHVLTEGAPNVIIGLGKGKMYTAADTIDLVQVNACDTAVVVVWAIMVDCS
jgi:hypothetical protein